MKISKRWLFGCICLIAAIWGLLSDTSESTTDKEVLHCVQRGPLSITVAESGTLSSQQELKIKSQVDGRKTILFLIEEGTRVEKGMILVELDRAALVDALEEANIRVDNAEAAFIREREQLAITQNKSLSEVEQSKQTVKFLKMDLENYKLGQYPQDLQVAKNTIILAEEELKRAEDKLDWSEKLAEEGFVTRSELEGDRLEVKRKRLDLELAQSKLKLLEAFTYKREIEKLESELYQAEQALLRAEKNALADTIRAEASLRAKESEWQRQLKKMQAIEQQIESCTIRAPRDGMVIYATSVNKRPWGNQAPLEVGQEVRERQDLIFLPTNTGMKVQLKIDEADLKRVRIGMAARVRVNALGGLQLTGRVEKIAPLPDQSSAWMNPDLKLYTTEVYLDESVEGLRTGMSCHVEIIVKHYEDVVYIPIQAVVSVDGTPTVFVHNQHRVEARQLVPGLSNNRMLTVRSGLEVGEWILLSPPLDSGALPQAIELAPTVAKSTYSASVDDWLSTSASD